MWHSGLSFPSEWRICKQRSRQNVQQLLSVAFVTRMRSGGGTGGTFELSALVKHLLSKDYRAARMAQLLVPLLLP